MRITDALKGVARLGIDAAPVIYYVENHPVFHRLAEPFFAAVDRDQIDAVPARLPWSKL